MDLTAHGKHTVPDQNAYELECPRFTEERHFHTERDLSEDSRGSYLRSYLLGMSPNGHGEILRSEAPCACVITAVAQRQSVAACSVPRTFAGSFPQTEGPRLESSALTFAEF